MQKAHRLSKFVFFGYRNTVEYPEMGIMLGSTSIQGRGGLVDGVIMIQIWFRNGKGVGWLR